MIIGMSSQSEISNCQRKRAYPSEKEALWAALDRMEVAGIDSQDLRAYQCFWCGRWHLSSKPKRRD